MTRRIWKKAVYRTSLTTMTFTSYSPPQALKDLFRVRMHAETKIMRIFFFLQNAENKGLNVKIKALEGPKRHFKGCKGSSSKIKAFKGSLGGLISISTLIFKWRYKDFEDTSSCAEWCLSPKLQQLINYILVAQQKNKWKFAFHWQINKTLANLR